mmetsp:Transcript_55133/g.66376  ORF Transcript_55133/g.66376 Transcript_55133/m.66376 type:complete len:388 (+) Transcript_55133:70-1233(+)
MSVWYRKIKVAETQEDLLNVCKLRYHVYVDELKRDNYNYIDNVKRILEDDLDNVDGVVNLMVNSPENKDADITLAGCARLHVPVPEKYNEMFGILDKGLFPGSTINDFAFFSRFMVKAEFRGRNGATDAIYEQCYIQAREMGAKYLMLNCTPSLASAYERKGWVRYKNTYWDQGMGMQMAMCLPMEDIPFLSTLGSFSILPASSIAIPELASTDGDNKPNKVKRGEWLTRILTQLEAPMVSSKLCSPSIVQKFIQRRMASKFMNQVPIFENTTLQERMAFLGSFGGCVPFIKVMAGDGISRVGDVRDEAFLVMSGRVRVEYEGIVLGYAGVGSLIGENAFLFGAKRTLTVNAKEDVELMVIAQITFMKSMKKTPELSVKFCSIFFAR